MLVHILESCFKPESGKTRTILDRGMTCDLPDDQAKTLISKGYAEPFKAKKEEGEDGEAKPKKGKAKDGKAA